MHQLLNKIVTKCIVGIVFAINLQKEDDYQISTCILYTLNIEMLPLLLLPPSAVANYRSRLPVPCP